MTASGRGVALADPVNDPFAPGEFLPFARSCEKLAQARCNALKPGYTGSDPAAHEAT